jgi:hypothetical protein
MQIVTTIECDPEVELVARTLYAYNSYPGQRPREIPWPPKLRQQISHYVRLAEAVVRAQREVCASASKSVSNGDRSEG